MAYIDSDSDIDSIAADGSFDSIAADFDVDGGVDSIEVDSDAVLQSLQSTALQLMVAAAVSEISVANAVGPKPKWSRADSRKGSSSKVKLAPQPKWSRPDVDGGKGGGKGSSSKHSSIGGGNAMDRVLTTLAEKAARSLLHGSAEVRTVPYPKAKARAKAKSEAWQAHLKAESQRAKARPARQGPHDAQKIPARAAR
jgi:hypothetical protein